MALFKPEEERAVRELLAGLERPVELAVVLGPEEAPLPGAREIDYSGEAKRLVTELAALSPLIEASQLAPPAYGVERFPAICILPEGRDAGLRYYGLPWGYELGSLVGACLEAGRPDSSLSEDSRAALEQLERDVSLEVFVTPT